MKTIVRYHLTPVKMAIIKSLPIMNAREGVKKRKLSYSVDGNENCSATVENRMEVS